MPYWRRLLHADILPQKLSRRKAMVIFWGSSGCLNQHRTRRSASRKASAIARSSPKLGSVTMIPSQPFAMALEQIAQRRDSSRVSTAPYLLSFG